MNKFFTALTGALGLALNPDVRPAGGGRAGGIRSGPTRGAFGNPPWRRMPRPPVKIKWWLRAARGIGRSRRMFEPVLAGAD
jgi:hypothetical protein